MVLRSQSKPVGPVLVQMVMKHLLSFIYLGLQSYGHSLMFESLKQRSIHTMYDVHGD